MPRPKYSKSMRRNAGGNVRVKALLTPLVRKRARTLDEDNKFYFKLYKRAKRTEHLPNGIPYKVVNFPDVHMGGAVTVQRVNQPLILVSSKLTRAERANAAMHEYEEWARVRSTEGLSQAQAIKIRNEAHDEAVKRENPRLRKSTLKKIGRYLLEWAIQKR
ncbi:MAG: hypothetical protein AABW72_01005 [archaeon]